MLETSRKLLLAGIRAAALTKEKIEGIVRKLIRQGEISREEEMKLLKKVLQKRGEEKQKTLETKIDLGINKAVDEVKYTYEKRRTGTKGKIGKTN